MIKITIPLLLVLTLIACSQPKKEQTPLQKMETAHHKADFLEKKAIQFHLKLNFGGQEAVNGVMTLLTNSNAGSLALNDSSLITFIGNKVYYSPHIIDNEGIRFSAYTWSYFFLLPHKISDQGAQLKPYINSILDTKAYLTSQLTFKTGTGDAPDDWYIIYADTSSHLIEVAAYIVTAGRSVKDAEIDPHAIKYHDYQLFDNVPIATKWTFWAWRKPGTLTKQLGDATLSDIKFLDLTIDDFTPPDNFKQQ